MTNPPPKTDNPRSFWESSKGTALAVVLLLVVSVSMFFGNLGGIGIWEPWEANEIKLGQEYATRGAPPELSDPKATSWNWAVPTYDNRPVDKPLLSTAILSKTVAEGEISASQVGDLEFSARLPFAFAALLLVLLGAAWIARRFGTFRGAVAGCVTATVPALYFGVHNLGSEIFFIVTSTLAVLAFFELAYDRGSRRWLWGAALAVALVLTVFEQRLMGLYLTLFVIASFAASEAALEEFVRRRDGPSAPPKFGMVEVVGGLGAVVVGTLVCWRLYQMGLPSEGDANVAEWAVQLVAMTMPVFLIFGAAWFGRKSKPGRALFSLPGLGAVAVGAGSATYLAYVYSDANPILLDGGKMFGNVQVFSYILENHIFERSLVEDHMSFDVVMRQVGFSLFPWVALLPAGFAYASYATRTSDDDGERGPEMFASPEAAKRLLMVWPVVAAIVVGAASAFDHYFYPAYFPITAAIALVITDREFFRRYPLAAYALGFVAVVVILMLGKDLERYPSRFVELYLALDENFALPEDFSWGALFKPLKYAWALLFAVHFFGLVSWALLTLRNAKRLPELLRAVRRRDWPALAGPPGDVSPMVRRAEEKEALRNEDTIPSRIARLIETPVGFAPLAVVVFWLSALTFLFAFVPEVTNHLSQRGVFETYTKLADDGEELYRYQVTSRDQSVYLQDVEQLKGSADFHEKFNADERFFAVIPRSKLAAINYEIRQRHKKNVAVLDARSSRLLLVSNRLEEGEKDHSFVADKIVEGEPQVDYPVLFETKAGEKKHPVFDDSLEFLGYSLNKERPKSGIPAFEWGEEMVITYYFRVLKRVPSSQKIFLHVDYPGNRINGDHYPNEGDFPTNYWLEGDVVKDVHPLTIDSYSTPGVYTLNMGFFLGSRRMSVEPREAHDGRDRITIGKIEVVSGL